MSEFPRQKTFGEFVADRYGPKWVYAAHATDRLRSKYPDSVVITPNKQRELTDDYAKEWGREYDPEFWQMLCALRLAETVLGSTPPNAQNNAAYAAVCDAIEAATNSKVKTEEERAKAIAAHLAAHEKRHAKRVKALAARDARKKDRGLRSAIDRMNAGEG